MTGSPTQCLVCGHEQWRPHLEILLRCSTCGFVTARLDAEIDARGLYEGDYFTGEEYLDYAADEAFFKRNFGKRLAAVLKHKSNGRLLEIGAAYGFFCDLAKSHFDVTGFEVNSQAVEHARDKLGLDVRGDDFLEIDAARSGGPFDVAVMWDVIEHLERPDRFIARISEVSTPDGLLVLTTGDIGSRLARVRGRKWRLIHPPSHLHYFDRRTITRLLANHGYDVIDIRAVGVARSFHQVFYSIFVLGLKSPRLHQLSRKCIPSTWGFTLNTFDIMQVTAKKKR